MGYFMGLFNFFVVIPQIVSGLLLGFDDQAPVRRPRRAMTLVLGGACMLIAGAVTLLVTDAAPVKAGADAARRYAVRAVNRRLSYRNVIHVSSVRLL